MTPEAIIRANTRPKPVGALGLSIWTADELTPLWEATEGDLERHRMGPPFWAFPWAGGQAVSRYILENREIVAGRRVLDLAAGSGLVALAAMRAGASAAVANDIDPFCEPAVALNADLNGLAVGWLGGDLLGAPPPAFDVITAGDVFYEKEMARRFLGFLEAAYERGVHVIVGDPGRTYFPRDSFRLLAEYDIETTTEIESMPIKSARVWGL